MNELARKLPPRGGELAGICAGLVLLVWIVFGQAIHFGFINFDDNQNVYDCPQVVDGLTMKGVEWAFTHAQVNRWAPVTVLSRMLDCQFFGLWAGGHHLTNILIHSLSTLVLFLFLTELTGLRWRSAFVAAIFGLHPLQVESVAWVSARGDLLCGLFFLLTLWSYSVHVRRPASGRYYWISLGCYALGLMSKSMIVTLPFILLLLDSWPLRRFGSVPFSRLLTEKIPFLLLAAASCIVTVIVPRQISSADRWPFWFRITRGIGAYIVYLRQFFWPAGLAVVSPEQGHAVLLWNTAGALALIAFISIAAFVCRKRRPSFLVGWLWFIGMLVPVIGFIQIADYSHADRYTYLPQIGLSIAGVWFAADWAGNRRSRRIVAAVLSAMVCVILVSVSRRQASYWRDDMTLWPHVLACTEGNFVAQTNYGGALFDRGRIEEAALHFREALREAPGFALTHNDLGNVLLRQGRAGEAIEQYREALRIKPVFEQARASLGAALIGEGRIDEGMDQCREALRINPDNAKAHNSLGIALVQRRRLDEAIAEFREASLDNPANPEPRENLGHALFATGQTEQAMAEYREALRISPEFALAHFHMGELLFRQGRVHDSVNEFQQAVRIDPANAEGHYGLALALMMQGDIAGAIDHDQKALALRPGKVPILNNLAWLLATAPQLSLRDGPKAVELALSANQASGGNDPSILDTLAAAYAQKGDFVKAVETANKALALASSNAPFSAALRQEIELYKANRPYVQGH